jgi:hypothetical protein
MGENNAVPAPKHSETVQLVIDIEMFTGSHWTQIQREEVAEMVRIYRFNQVGSVLLRVQKLAIEAGYSDLAEKLYSTKFSR